MSETGCRRAAGVLLPMFSLPSPYGIGTMGAEARGLVDFLAEAGQSVWQLLPMGPTGYGNSPYQPLSSFAGNPWFIDPDELWARGLLKNGELPERERSARVDYGRIFGARNALLRRAFARFDGEKSGEYTSFCADNSRWLEDFALYMALKERFGLRPWQEWEENIRLRRPEALGHWKGSLRGAVEFWKFTQYEFFREWYELKAYANAGGVRLMGDLPFYAAPDSADTWSEDIYITDDRRRPTAVAGVPPDYFSSEGQLWGNFLYDWDAKGPACLAWWSARTKHAASMYDALRIDHFIGAVRYWAVPFGAENAVKGELRRGPGESLAAAIDLVAGERAVIAEDLGAVTPEVRELMRRHGYPGMRVLQFAFNGERNNEHLPENVGEDTVVYTGTHDNDTAEGFLASAGAEVRSAFPNARSLIGAALGSGAALAVIPAQDWLGLGSGARVNTPSTASGNWEFRIRRGQLTPALARAMRRETEKSGRLPE